MRLWNGEYPTDWNHSLLLITHAQAIEFGMDCRCCQGEECNNQDIIEIDYNPDGSGLWRMIDAPTEPEQFLPTMEHLASMLRKHKVVPDYIHYDHLDTLAFYLNLQKQVSKQNNFTKGEYPDIHWWLSQFVA